MLPWRARQAEVMEVDSVSSQLQNQSRRGLSAMYRQEAPVRNMNSLLARGELQPWTLFTGVSAQRPRAFRTLSLCKQRTLGPKRADSRTLQLRKLIGACLSCEKVDFPRQALASTLRTGWTYCLLRGTKPTSPLFGHRHLWENLPMFLGCLCPVQAASTRHL